MMTGFNKERILQALEILSCQESNSERTLNLVKDYNVSNISEKILRIIISYTDYVRKKIWKENW